MNSRSCGRQRDKKRQWRVLTGSRPAQQADAGFDRATEARSTPPDEMPERVRESQPQLAAAAPTAPRFEARVARIARCG